MTLKNWCPWLWLTAYWFGPRPSGRSATKQRSLRRLCPAYPRRLPSDMLRVKTRLFLALIPLSYVYARLAGGTLPYFLFYFFTLTVLLAYLWVRRTSGNLAAIYETSTRVVRRGDPLPVSVRLENEGFTPVPWLRITDHTFQTSDAESVKPVGLHVLGSFRSRVVTYELRAERRGCYRLGPLRATYGDIFGIFEAVADFEGRREIVVYPRFTPIVHLPLPLKEPFGHVRTRQRAYEDPTELAELRPMRPGDNPKKIHWKTTARMGEPYVREHELKATADVIIVVDLNETVHAVDGADSTLEKAVEVAASVGHYCLNNGYRTRLVGWGAHSWDAPFRPDASGFRQLMEVLARVEAGEAPRLADLLAPESVALPPRSTIIVVTPDIDPRLLENLLHLKNRGYGVLLAYVHPEQYLKEFPLHIRRATGQVQKLNEEGITSIVVQRDEEFSTLVERRFPSARRAVPGRGGVRP